MKAIKLEGRIISKIEIENTLEAFQSAVEGYIETLQIVPDKAVMVVNEEGLNLGLMPNPCASTLAGTLIVGNALVVGVDGEEFTDVPDDIADEIMMLFTKGGADKDVFAKGQ